MARNSTALVACAVARARQTTLSSRSRTVVLPLFFAIASEIAHEIVVMCAGRVVERAPADSLFETPLHPYTLGLIATLPDPSRRTGVLPVIPGGVSDLGAAATGCRFADRCERADAGCRRAEPALDEVAPAHFVACFKVRR
jgi:oligopeptide/dipeptide ABC transporter ATP-binding protein